MTNKITKAQMFAMIKAEVADKPEMVEFIDHELELLARKSSSKKQTKTQIENAALKEEILEVLSTLENGATASEMIKADTRFALLSNQKMATMLNQLVADHKVAKTTEKGKSIFSVVTD